MLRGNADDVFGGCCQLEEFGCCMVDELVAVFAEWTDEILDLYQLAVICKLEGKKLVGIMQSIRARC